MYLILIVLILVGILTYLKYTFNEDKYIKSDKYGDYYYIIRRGEKPLQFLKDSADTLADLDNRISKLISSLETKYSSDNTKNYWIKMLRYNYIKSNGVSILSEAALDNRYTTYTVNKTDIHVCLRSRDESEKLYDINLLMYVLLHELAHLCNYSPNGQPIQGHGAEFRNIFKILVSEAISIGIYNYINYTKYPAEYCGMIISSQIYNPHN